MDLTKPQVTKDRSKQVQRVVSDRDADSYRDDRHAVWHLGEHLGKGGQGQVHRAREGGAAIKILTQPNRSLQHIRRLPIEDLDIAGPVTFLEDGRGYTMELARDMDPLAASLVPASLQPAHGPEWFKDTGGLRKRLRIAANVAGTVSSLHARGLVYGDLQRSNVMASSSAAAARSVLIDADNIDYEGQPTSIVGTPGFVPLEVLERSEPLRLTRSQDCWALGVLVFWLLTANHPFVDADVRSLPPGRRMVNPSPERFIDRAVGEMHAAGPGPGWALSPALRRAARQTFTSGCTDPDARVSARRWRLLLERAHRHTVVCKCGWSQFPRNQSCAYCGKRLRAELTYACWSAPDALAPIITGRFLRGSDVVLGALDLGSAERVRVELRYQRKSETLRIRTDGCRAVDRRGKSVETLPFDTSHIEVFVRGPWQGERAITIARPMS